MHGCIISTVATDGLVLKYQAISIQSADLEFIALDQIHTKNMTFTENHLRTKTRATRMQSILRKL